MKMLIVHQTIYAKYKITKLSVFQIQMKVVNMSLVQTVTIANSMKTKLTVLPINPIHLQPVHAKVLNVQRVISVPLNTTKLSANVVVDHPPISSAVARDVHKDSTVKSLTTELNVSEIGFHQLHPSHPNQLATIYLVQPVGDVKSSTTNQLVSVGVKTSSAPRPNVHLAMNARPSTTLSPVLKKDLIHANYTNVQLDSLVPAVQTPVHNVSERTFFQISAVTLNVHLVTTV